METSVDGQSKSTAVLPAVFPFERLGNYLLRFINRLKQTGKSAHTISAYRNDLTLFTAFLTEKNIDPRTYFQNVQEEWVVYLQGKGRKSAASLRRAQMSVRTFLHFLVQEKIIEGSPFLEVKSPRQPKHDLLAVTPEHFRTLTQVLKERANVGDEKSIRDWALVLLLGECGLKATEAACLTWRDIFFEESVTNEEKDLGGSVHVAGPSERILKFGSELRESLIALREVRKILGLHHDQNSKLFYGYMNVTRKTRTDALHRHGIKFIVYEVCEEILGIPYNSESLRNHAIVKWLNQGLSQSEVAELAGYSSLHSLERFALQGRGQRKPRRQPRSRVEEEEA